MERSIDAIQHRVRILQISRQDYWWSDKEIEILKEYYESKTWRELVVLLPNRNRDTIQKKAGELGLRSSYNLPWTKEEDDILRQYFPKEGRQTYLRLKNRSENATYNHANALGLHIESHFWSEEEKEIIYKYYPIEGPQIINRLPNRSAHAIKVQASKLGVKTNKNKPLTANGKKIYQYNLTTGDFIQEFESAAEASRRLKLSADGTAAAARGDRKSAGGYLWSYIKADNYFDIKEKN
jgi:hypothetical protein